MLQRKIKEDSILRSRCAHSAHASFTQTKSFDDDNYEIILIHEAF